MIRNYLQQWWHVNLLYVSLCQHWNTELYDVKRHFGIDRGVYPPLTHWSKFPLSPSLPSPPLRSRPPLLRLGGLEERFSSPSGSGQSPAAKRYLVNFRLKISPLVATIFRSFSGNKTSNYDRRVLPVHYQMCQYIRVLICREINHSVFAETSGESALIINALPP